MKTKIKPFTLRTYIKEVKNTVTNTVLLDQIPKDFDFSKVTDLQIASVAEIRAKMTAINGTILINSAANLENQEAVGEFDFWGKFGTPRNHDFGFTYWKIQQTAGEIGQPEQHLNAADDHAHKQEVTLYQDTIPEQEEQLTETEFLAKVKDVMMTALSEDGKLRLIGSRGADCNDLVTLVTEEEIHTKGIYFRGADGQEHKLNQDLPELAELEEILTPDEQDTDPENNAVFYKLSIDHGQINGIVDNPTIEEIKQHVINGKEVWLDTSANNDFSTLCKLVCLDIDAIFFLNAFINAGSISFGLYIYDDKGSFTYSSITGSK